jgi:hypothetical protein
MLHRRPDLIVPLRDRRRGRRFLTKRNVGYSALALVIAFILISIHSEMRHGTADGDYGRLYRREVPPTPPVAAPVEVVTEERPADLNGADPLLTAPAIRGQRFLDADTASAAAVTTRAAMAARDGKTRIAIVGDPSGIAVATTSDRDRPRLKGGIFKSQ